jgi:hypothetical protein
VRNKKRKEKLKSEVMPKKVKKNLYLKAQKSGEKLKPQVRHEKIE